MNLLDITHFERGKNVGLCVKQLLARLHGGILWMDRSVPIDVALIAKITGLSTIGTQPEKYVENKVQKKRNCGEVQFGTNMRSRGIVIKDVVTRFTSKLMACKLLRKCRKEEAPAGVIAVAAQCAKGVMFSWAPYLLN
jgi:hypothetical protein